MKLFFRMVIIAIICINSNSIAQGQNGNNHHIFTVNDQISELVLELDGAITLQPTEGSRVLVETTIETNLANSNMLKILINGGRYDIVAEEGLAAQQLILKSKGQRNVLMVRGEECTEIVSYVVYVPSNIHLLTKDKESAVSIE